MRSPATLAATPLMLVALALGTAARGQSDEPDLLFPGGGGGGYGGPTFTVASFMGEPCLFPGGGGAWQINRNVALGGMGGALASDIKAPEVAQTNPDGEYFVKSGFGGVFLEFTVFPERLVHLRIRSLLAAGGLTYSLRNQYSLEDAEGTAFFMFSNVVSVEVNLFKFVRAFAGVGYRTVEGGRLSGLRASELSGMETQFGLKFGVF
jgi:hypothetical protein